MLYIFAKVFLKWIFWLVLRPKVLHRKNIRCKGKVIYVCNHLALPDPIAVAMVSPRVIHFMAKAELFESRISRLFYRLLLVFPVSPSSADLRSIKKALDLLEKGKAFGIFPEGHRSALGGTADRLQKGAAYISLKSGAPIIPIYLSPDTWEKKRIRMAVGEKIYPETVKARNEAQKAVDAISCRIQDAFITLREELESS